MRLEPVAAIGTMHMYACGVQSAANASGGGRTNVEGVAVAQSLKEVCVKDLARDGSTQWQPESQQRHWMPQLAVGIRRPSRSRFHDRVRSAKPHSFSQAS